MQKQLQSREKFCGNCHYHSVFNYPDQIFCMFHFSKQRNAVYSTLDVCENWKQDNQDCFCVQEALKKKQNIKQ